MNTGAIPGFFRCATTNDKGVVGVFPLQVTGAVTGVALVDERLASHLQSLVFHHRVGNSTSLHHPCLQNTECV